MIRANAKRFELARRFTIARGGRDGVEVVEVEIARKGHVGRGECVPYARYGESVQSVLAQIAGLPADIERPALQYALPAGAARNAVDCALWDLEAKQSGVPAWKLAALSAPQSVETAYTLSLESPHSMREQARAAAERPLLKIKLGTADDLPRLIAVREGAPHARLIVDANEGWRVEDYQYLAPKLVALGVELVEQPFPAGQDDALNDLDRRLPVCADESAHDLASLDRLIGKYDVINIKLDKTGGLTEAIRLRQATIENGLDVFVGCMVASSLAMAPAMLLTQGARWVDLDGPLLLAEDRNPGLHYSGSYIDPPESALWG